MASVQIQFVDKQQVVIKTVDLTTTSDNTYVFDDISNFIHKDGEEFSEVPEGTKEIVLRILCDM